MHFFRTLTKVFFLVLITLLFNFGILEKTQAREISKAAEIFKNAKNGVVTIVTAGHGSGFLVDNSGLIITNSHVINEAGDDIRVRFGQNKVIKGKVIINDRVSDIAIVLVNLKNISDFTILKPFIPNQNDPLVLVGEQILAIGSPVEWETLEKTLTTGIVSKYENDIIRHDASLNGGNSGGPLLNYDGFVVGINTFAESDRGPAISGSVSINKALPLIDKAKKQINSNNIPSGDLLPDVNPVSYSVDILDKNYKQLDEKIVKKRSDLYTIKTYNYNINILTPPIQFRRIALLDKEVLKKRKKRASKRGYELNDDEYLYKNINKYYDYKKPVVTILINPNPQPTKGTYARAILAGVAAGLAGVYAPVNYVYEYKKDFNHLDLKITDNPMSKQGRDIHNICTPYISGKIPLRQFFSNSILSESIEFKDKSYLGIYEYNPKCFETDKPMSLIVKSEGEEIPIEIKLPETIKKFIIEDFTPYWEYVKELSSKSSIDKL